MALAKTADDHLSFSPREASETDLAVAVLVHRISRLPKESLADLAELAPELARCEDSKTFSEIAETIREIMFPELIGDLHVGKAGDTNATAGLDRRIEWIAAKIKEERRKAALTQKELAEKSNLPQSHISRLEAGKHSPSFKTLERLAQALGISVGELDPAN